VVLSCMPAGAHRGMPCCHRGVPEVFMDTVAAATTTYVWYIPFTQLDESDEILMLT
jgi:hypothetical protein